MFIIVVETIYDEDMNVVVGQKVRLPCNGLSNNSSVRWQYRQTKLSNPQLIVSANGDKTVVFQPSGRFAANRTSFNTFTLIIYEVQMTDLGFYGCVANNTYRITRLSVQRK